MPNSLTSIGSSAFSSCSGLTNITFSNSLTSIGNYAFADCSSLKNITLPKSLTYIGAYAFKGCINLTSLTIPSSVTTIGGYAVDGCTRLQKIFFLGNAPTTFVLDAYANQDINKFIFGKTAPDFKVFYLSSKNGFTTPTWNGYPTVRIDEATYPAASWLLSHNMNYDSSLSSDPDGDGVSLFLTYALKLDPSKPQISRLPNPVMNADTLSITFDALSQGVVYEVKTSTDMIHWTTEGVTQTPLSADGKITGSVVHSSSGQRFLRLFVR